MRHSDFVEDLLLHPLREDTIDDRRALLVRELYLHFVEELDHSHGLELKFSRP